MADQANIDAWLASHQLTFGRHPTTKCPFCPKATSGNPAVLVNKFGVRCFHCKRAASWDALLGNGTPPTTLLWNAARNLVHLAHEQFVIKSLFPQVPERIICKVWALLLRSVNADRLNGTEAEQKKWSAAIEAAASPAFKLVRMSSGAWASAKTLRSQKVTADRTLKYLPWARWPPMIDVADSGGPLEGFVPLHAVNANQVIAPFAGAPPGTVIVRRAPDEGDPLPVDVVANPGLHELECAWNVIAAAFPGIVRGYHFGIVAALLVAQTSVGTPPFLYITGQSGSGKTAQVHLAAAAVGTYAASIALGSRDDTERKVGLALENGSGAMLFDEVNREEGLYGKLGSILAANSVWPYRPKFSNERNIPFRAIVVLAGSTLPDAIVRSPELDRRGVGYRIPGAQKEWALVDPRTKLRLDFSDARKIPELREALDTVTAAVWHRLRALGPAADWRQLLLDEYGGRSLHELDVVDNSARGDMIAELFEIYHEASDEAFSKGGRYRGWYQQPVVQPTVSTQSTVMRLLGELVDLDADGARFKAEISEIDKLNLAPILQFEKPQLQLLIRRHGRTLYFKFAQLDVMRGKEMKRNDLPLVIRNKKETIAGRPPMWASS